ncbi:MAG: nitroreductase [Polaromonas sp.]
MLAPHASLLNAHPALAALLARRSAWPLVEPAPPQAVLDLAFDAALCAPDHGKLRPWRFIVIRGAARDRLGEVFAQAAQRLEPSATADNTDNTDRFRAKASAAPVLIALGVHLVPGHKVPEIEQTMAVAAAAMNLLNALHQLGYGGFWASGKNSHDASVRQALGLGPDDRLAGFLYVGTPKPDATPADRPARAQHVREWQGPVN